MIVWNYLEYAGGVAEISVIRKEIHEMYLQHHNLLIRKAQEEDAPILCKWWNDGKVMAHAGFPFGLRTTVEAVEDRIQAATVQNSLLMIEIAGEPAGEMNYRALPGNEAEIGIKICQFQQQGKGYGTVLITMLIGSLFKELNYATIRLDTNIRNARAQHVFEKIGFKQTALHRDAWKNQLGEWQSSVEYEMTKAYYFKRFG
ncbi:GNAT family N-acetyltransferase [Paenibacillus tengchongensis]|uniref:GNAT family N-acetyltransferase n=1 Tax=Paenibacillus tengchongensis TaxID=2608684 RepID=UPI001C9E4A11|nr:GNAT family protein [Paenibacillus tengchongensis]